MLIGIVGEDFEAVNDVIIMSIAKLSRSLLIDCANCANPHKYYPLISEEEMKNIDFLGVELLYKFRSILMIKCKDYDNIAITVFEGLFNYQNELENKNVLDHCWEIMKSLSTDKNLIVGIIKDSESHISARKFCDKLGVI